MIYTIYRLTNTINGKVYIGVTNNFKKRMREHSYATNNYLISRAIRKYGWSNFTQEIILQSKDKDYAYRIAEAQFILEHNSTDADKGYNLTDGGQGTTGYIVAEETRAKQRAKKTGRTLTTDHKRKISESLEGRTCSEETKAKLSDSLKGNKNFEGKTFSDEVKQLLSEQKAKDWIAVSPDGEEVHIHNMRKFCLEHNLQPSAMSKVLNGKSKHHKGWTCVSD